MTTPIANIDNTTLLSLTGNLDIGDVADPALRLTYFQYLNVYIQTITTAFNAFIANGSIGSVNLADLSVLTAKIADLAVTTGKIADLAVTTAKLNDMCVTLAKMAAASVGTTQLVDLSVTRPKIAIGAVGTSQLDPTLLASYGDIAVQAEFDRRGLNVMKYIGLVVGTDWTAAINAAIDAQYAAGGGKVFIPSGAFSVLSNLILKEKVTITGMGESSILAISNYMSIQGNNVTLKDLAIYSKTALAIAIPGTSIAIITNTTIDNVKFTFDEVLITTDWLPLAAQFADNLKIKNCYAECGGFQLVQCANFLIQSNYIDGKWKNTNEPVHVSQFSSGGKTIHNTIVNTATDGIDHYTSGDRCIVAHNSIIGCSGTAFMEIKVMLRDSPYTGGSSDQQGYVESTIVSNNILRDFRPPANGTYTGIYAAYIDLRASASYEIAKTQRGLIITNNIIEDFWVTAGAITPTFVGIYVNCHNSIISGNIIRNIYTHGNSLSQTCGIQLGTTTLSIKAYACEVTGNVITSEGSGICVQYAEKCDISHNIIRKDEVSGITPKYGFYISNIMIDCIVNNNIFESSVTNNQAIFATSSSVVVTRCSFTLNKFFGGGFALTLGEFNTISGNTIVITAASKAAIVMGTTATVQLGNKFDNNTLVVNDFYSIILDSQKAFTVIGNTFKEATWGVLVELVSTDGTITNNVSYSQTQTALVRYLDTALTNKYNFIECNNNLVS